MICKCTKLSIEKLEELADSNINDWYDASEQTGAGRYCGGCLRTLREKFNEARLAKTKPTKQRKTAA